MPTAAPAPTEAATAGSWDAGGGVCCFSCCCCCGGFAGWLGLVTGLLWTGSSNWTGSGCSGLGSVLAGCWLTCCPENLSMELGRGGTADMLLAWEPSSLASRLGVAPRSTLQDSHWISTKHSAPKSVPRAPISAPLISTLNVNACIADEPLDSGCCVYYFPQTSS